MQLLKMSLGSWIHDIPWSGRHKEFKNSEHNENQNLIGIKKTKPVHLKKYSASIFSIYS